MMMGHIAYTLHRMFSRGQLSVVTRGKKVVSQAESKIESDDAAFEVSFMNEATLGKELIKKQKDLHKIGLK